MNSHSLQRVHYCVNFSLLSYLIPSSFIEVYEGSVKIAISRNGGSEGIPPRDSPPDAGSKSGVSSSGFIRRYFRAFEGLERRDAESLISQAAPTRLS